LEVSDSVLVVWRAPSAVLDHHFCFLLVLADGEVARAKVSSLPEDYFLPDGHSSQLKLLLQRLENLQNSLNDSEDVSRLLL